MPFETCLIWFIYKLIISEKNELLHYRTVKID